MEKEVSNIIELGVALVALAAVIGIMWFTVFQGQEVASDAAVVGSSIVSSVQVGALTELTDSETELPTASVFSLLKTYSNEIESYTCKVCNPTADSYDIDMDNFGPTKSLCVQNHLTGKVNVELVETSSGVFHMVIHDAQCDWYDDEDYSYSKYLLTGNSSYAVCSCASN